MDKIKNNRLWNQDELQQLLSSIQGEKHEHLYATAVHTTMRIHELLELRWENIDFDKKRISIPTRVETKANGVQITEKILFELTKQKKKQVSLLGEKAEEQPYVFTDANGKQLTPQRVERDFQKIIKEANLPPILLSSLRHSIGVMLLKSGVNIMVVSNLLRHHSMETTFKMYSHHL